MRRKAKGYLFLTLACLVAMLAFACTGVAVADCQLQAVTDKQIYDLGETVKVTGTVTSDGVPTSVKVAVEWDFKGGPVSIGEVKTGYDGTFTAIYTVPAAVTKDLDPRGIYAVYVNAASITKKINFAVGTGSLPPDNGGGTSVTPTSPPLKVTPGDVASQITTGAVQVTIKVKESAEFEAAAIKQVMDAGKPLVISREDGAASITVPAGAVELPAGSTLTVSVTPVSDTAASNMTVRLGQGMQLAGKAFELTGKVLSNGVESSVSFKKPVAVTISFADAGIQPGQEDKLGAYLYNSATGQWDYLGGEVDKVNKTITFYTGHFSYYALMLYEKTFTDLAGHWAKQDIELMAARHVAKGSPDGMFYPDQTVTRAEFSAMLARVLGLNPEEAQTPVFDDVKQGDWFFGEVMAAYKTGIVKGDGVSFLPDEQITREQMAVMAVRALASKGIEGSLTSEQVTARLAAFTDGNEIAAWAADGVAAAVERQLVTGYPDGSFSPNGSATRAESLVMLKRMMDKL